MWRKNFLDDPIKSQSVHGISFGDVIKVGTLGLVDPEGAASDAATAGRDAAALSNQAIQESTTQNIDFQKWLWGEQKDLAQPFVDAGVTALDEYQNTAPLTMQDVYSEPGYQFGLNEGTRAIENSCRSKRYAALRSHFEGIKPLWH